MINRRRRRWLIRTIVIGAVLLLVVVLSFPILMTLVAPKLISQIMKSSHDVALAEAASIAQQFRLYMLDNNMKTVPSNATLVVLSGGFTPYLNPKDLIDPWGRPYIIIAPGDNGAAFKIISYGADGVPGGEGPDADVSN